MLGLKWSDYTWIFGLTLVQLFDNIPSSWEWMNRYPEILYIIKSKAKMYKSHEIPIMKAEGLIYTWINSIIQILQNSCSIHNWMSCGVFSLSGLFQVTQQVLLSTCLLSAERQGKTRHTDNILISLSVYFYIWNIDGSGKNKSFPLKLDLKMKENSILLKTLFIAINLS